MEKKKILIIRAPMKTLENMASDNAMMYKLKEQMTKEGRKVTNENVGFNGTVVNFDDGSSIAMEQLSPNIRGMRADEVYVNDYTFRHMPDELKLVLKGVLNYTSAKNNETIKIFGSKNGSFFVENFKK